MRWRWSSGPKPKDKDKMIVVVAYVFKGSEIFTFIDTTLPVGFCAKIPMVHII